MFIRSTRVQTPPDKLDAAIANFKQQVLPASRSAPGNLGATLLVDRQSGAGIGITYWESAKALAAAEQMGIKTRTDAAKNVSGTQIVNVERSEIVIMERAATPKAGTFIRVNTLNADPDKVDALTVFVRNKVLPVLKPQKGFRSAVMAVDRQTGRSSVATTWDTLADLKESESKISGLRQDAARAGGVTSPDGVEVEIFDVAVIEVAQAVAAPSSR